MKTIVEYSDYREFIRDYYAERKREKSTFSWRVLSKRAGFVNPSFLPQVSQGKKNLGTGSVLRVGKALGLSGNELEFWRFLVLFNQTSEHSQRNRLLLELAKLKGSVRSTPISRGFSAYYSRWYIPAIRELVTLFDFGDDYALLGGSLLPPISEDEARFAVQILSQFGFICRAASGRWIETQRALRSGCPKDRSALVRYHRDMLSKASESLARFDRDHRHVAGMTVGVSKECFQMILAEVEKCKNRVVALVDADTSSDMVMQLAWQFFPLGAVPGRFDLKCGGEGKK